MTDTEKSAAICIGVILALSALAIGCLIGMKMPHDSDSYREGGSDGDGINIRDR